ncbi:hypothetical protein WH47_08921 [Habropoda laboriosa]|uniref:Chitin-binding type-2 domain-containing protein n=1 Tax=Habropoda laboriosa TaxID=597456 RepID=A0A0L7R6Q6_9HYME|nr:hypothetical protein WH47_08921 [Habropoda laboriosa]
MECPLIPGTTERLVFNPTAQVCDWPGSVPDVKCSASEPCVAPTQIQDCTFFKPCTAGLFEKMAHDTDCHNFYLCTDGQKMPVTCPNDEIFNAEKKQCEKAKCGSQCYITGNCN